MSPDLDKKLCKAFPYLYADRNASVQETCMCWGFECGDGWYQLIYDLSKDLEAEIVKYIEEHPDEDYPKAAQVKEKFGTLIFYMTFGSDRIYELIAKAEKKSAKTCEACGKPGQLNDGPWFRTLCKDCTR